VVGASFSGVVAGGHRHVANSVGSIRRTLAIPSFSPDALRRQRCVSPSLTTSEGDWKTCVAQVSELGGVFCRRLPSFGGTAQAVVGGKLRVSLLTGRHLATRTPPGLVLGGGFFGVRLAAGL